MTQTTHLHLFVNLEKYDKRSNIIGEHAIINLNASVIITVPL